MERAKAHEWQRMMQRQEVHWLGWLACWLACWLAGWLTDDGAMGGKGEKQQRLKWGRDPSYFSFSSHCESFSGLVSPLAGSHIVRTTLVLCEAGESISTKWVRKKEKGCDSTVDHTGLVQSQLQIHSTATLFRIVPLFLDESTSTKGGGHESHKVGENGEFTCHQHPPSVYFRR